MGGTAVVTAAAEKEFYVQQPHLAFFFFSYVYGLLLFVLYSI